MIDIIKETEIATIGSGNPVLIINGGPGFSHHYLKEPFQYLSDKYQLNFYDQPGCGGTSADKSQLTLQATAEHLKAIIADLSKEKTLTVIAHSWGGTLYMAAVALGGISERIVNSVLVAPMPWTSDLYEKARLNFINNIPEEALEKFGQALADQKTGGELMDILQPYYTPKPLPISGEIYNFKPDTWMAVNKSLGDFDFREAFHTLTKKHIILGEKDFITADLFENLVTDKSQISVMKDIGHAPFSETPEEFQKLMNSFL